MSAEIFGDSEESSADVRLPKSKWGHGCGLEKGRAWADIEDGGDACAVGEEDDVVAWDDMKHRELDPKEVKKARQVEMGYVREHNVYTYAPVAECRAVTGAEPIGTKWLDTNKGDERCPVYRSRWVAQQYRRAWLETAFFLPPQTSFT